VTHALVLGIDVGTQGVRVLAVAADGVVAGRGADCSWSTAPAEAHEQDPEQWWASVVAAVGQLGPLRDRVVAVAVSCTSGTVCVLDERGAPLLPALMYSDPRGAGLTELDSSWAAAKLHWLAAERAAELDRAAQVTSPGGFLAGRLTGRRAPVDHTQAMKFGLDPGTLAWRELPVDVGQLPEVVPTGTPIGAVAPEIAAALGLPATTTVVAGCTDGVAAQVACGFDPGVWAVSIGSTVVWKTVAAEPVVDAAAGVYSHRGPDGTWLAGAASNAGARILSTWATDAELDALARSARFDAGVRAVYPSTVVGERFPFVDRGFVPVSIAPDTAPADRYAAEVLGLAFVERWGCEVLEALGCPPRRVVRATGGTAEVAAMCRLRADVLGTPVEVPAEPSSAFGAAVVAAAGLHGGVAGAARAMVRVGRRYEPSGSDGWDDAYARFRRTTQGQVQGDDHA
jgi:sugar (pentulose or hexulose) kinase